MINNADSMKKKEIAAFTAYLESRDEEQAAEISGFFEELSMHCALNKKDSKTLRRDFENALLYYDSAAVPMKQALMRLSIEHLGGFYVNCSLSSRQWKKKSGENGYREVSIFNFRNYAAVINSARYSKGARPPSRS